MFLFVNKNSDYLKIHMILSNFYWKIYMILSNFYLKIHTILSNFLLQIFFFLEFKLHKNLIKLHETFIRI
jgi:hypothetical protein